MLNKIRNNLFYYTTYVVIVFLILTTLTDFVEKIGHNYDLVVPKLNKYVKLFFLLFSLFIVALYRFKDKVKNKKLIIIPLVFFLFFFLKNYYINQVPALIRLFFLIGIVPFFFIVKEKYLKSLKSKTFQVLKVIILVNLFFVLIGFVFDIQLFHTYQNGNRFGFNGLFLNQVQPTYFYISCLFIFYKKNNLFLGLVILLGLMLGTKAIYVIFSFFIFVVARELYVTNKKLKYRIMFLVSLGLLISLIIAYLLFTSQIFSAIVRSEGLLTAFFSYRNVYLLDILREINTENFNVFFGTISLSDYRSEFSFIDIFLFLGLTGLVFYLIYLTYIFQIFVNSRLGKIYFTFILITAFFSGNLFSFPVNCFMFILTIVVLDEDITSYD